MGNYCPDNYLWTRMYGKPLTFIKCLNYLVTLKRVKLDDSCLVYDSIL